VQYIPRETRAFPVHMRQRVENLQLATGSAMLLGRRVNCERGGLTNKLGKMFLAKMSNDLKLVCAHGANSKRLRSKLNVRELSLSNLHTWLYASW